MTSDRSRYDSYQSYDHWFYWQTTLLFGSICQHSEVLPTKLFILSTNIQCFWSFALLDVPQFWVWTSFARSLTAHYHTMFQMHLSSGMGSGIWSNTREKASLLAFFMVGHQHQLGMGRYLLAFRWKVHQRLSVGVIYFICMRSTNVELYLWVDYTFY